MCFSNSSADTSALNEEGSYGTDKPLGNTTPTPPMLFRHLRIRIPTQAWFRRRPDESLFDAELGQGERLKTTTQHSHCSDDQ